MNVRKIFFQTRKFYPQKTRYNSIFGLHPRQLNGSYVIKKQRTVLLHLPFILYHWRVIENSTASDASAKSYTTDAGIEAIRHFLEHSGQNASVDKGNYPNTYKVNWALPDEQPLVSLVIPTRDGYDILKQCLESIYDKTSYKNFEIIWISTNNIFK